MTALKQALLLYDELLFVDSVDPQARAVYVREAQAAGVDPTSTRRWMEAEDAYELLLRNGVARTVFSNVLDDRVAAEAIATSNLDIDVKRNRASRFFPGLHRWQILPDRVPRGVLDGYEPRALNWAGFNIVEVPYTVGASVATTYAIAIAHEARRCPNDRLIGMPPAAAREAAKSIPLSSLYPDADVPLAVALAGRLRRASSDRRLETSNEHRRHRGQDEVPSEARIVKWRREF